MGPRRGRGIPGGRTYMRISSKVEKPRVLGGWRGDKEGSGVW